MTFKAVSVNALMLYFEQRISEEVLDEVQTTYLVLKNIEGIIDLTPSYCSILIHFNILIYDHQSLEQHIKKALTKKQAIEHKQDYKHIIIPTDYNNNLDLQRVAEHNKISVEKVIYHHTQRTYRVYAIGFMVGFAYLAAVHKDIVTPRLTTPRKKVPKGSVALADHQTAVYPQDSAGGWNIIGHTEFTNYHSFSIGDRVKFERI